MSEDYNAMLKAMNLTQAQMDAAKAQCENYLPSSEVSLGPSIIEGIGAFVKAPCFQDAIAAIAMKDKCWTAAGRFTNHSSQPNTKAVRLAGHVEFVSLKPLHAGDELTVDYIQVKAALQGRLAYV